MCLRPLKDFTHLRPVIHFLEVHQLDRCAGDDKTVPDGGSIRDHLCAAHTGFAAGETGGLLAVGDAQIGQYRRSGADGSAMTEAIKGLRAIFYVAAGIVTAFKMAGYFFPVRLFDSDHKEIYNYNK